MQIPNDLVPLPTSPWVHRPDSLPLDFDECRTALWMARGNITKAAELVKVTAARMRSYVRNNAALTREGDEAREQLKDIAEDVVYEALTDQDPTRKDQMARYVLSGIGKDRGYGAGNGTVNIKNAPGGKIVVQWGDGSSFDEPETIDATAKEVADVD